jgi:hypothetical protein
VDGVERAIRSALDKGDAGDKAFRERVYRQANAALDKAAANNPGHSDTIEARRRGLQQTIALIESEFAPALGGVVRDEGPTAAAAPRVDVGAPPARAGSPRAEPSFSPMAEAADAPRRGAASSAGPELSEERRPLAPRRGGRRRMARLLVWVTLLAGLAMLFWWAYGSGLLGGRIDGSVPNPPQVLQEEEFTPPADGGDNQAPRLTEEVESEANWIGIFEPSDPTTVRAPSGASADVRQADGEEFLRIRSGASAESAVIFDVGQGVLEQIAGRRAVFSILARAEGDRPLQMSIGCNFGALGDCGRRRYDVATETGEYLFEIDMPQARPAGAGEIRISTALGGEPGTLDIFTLRVSIAE